MAEILYNEFDTISEDGSVALVSYILYCCYCISPLSTCTVHVYCSREKVVSSKSILVWPDFIMLSKFIWSCTFGNFSQDALKLHQ